MTAPRPEGSESGEANGFARLSDAVRAVIAGDVADEMSLAGRERFLAAVAPPRAHATGIAWGAAGVMATGAAGFALSHSVGVGSAIDGVPSGNGYVSGSSNPTVRFASGSSVQFAAGSRGRVSDSKATRARVVLEEGHATVRRGQAHPKEDFLIEAGPYAMKSDGGAFDVSWSGSVLEVRVASGAVMVEGPVARDGLTLYGDQAFVAREGDGEARCF